MMRDKVEIELDRLQRQGIIAPTEFNEWASPIVPVLKGDGMDHLKPDEGIILSRYSLYTHIRSEGQNAAEFIADLRRLAGPCKFGAVLADVLRDFFVIGINREVILHDILITGRDSEEHLNNLGEALHRLDKVGLRLKRSKCIFMAPEVEFLGWKLVADNIRPTDPKTKTIKNAPKPQNVTELLTVEMSWIRKAWFVLSLAVAVRAVTADGTMERDQEEAASCTPPDSARAEGHKPWRNPRLPATLRPINYEVQLWPWLFAEGGSGLFLFHGRSQVTFHCLNRTNVLVLHTKGLNFTKPVRVSRADNSSVAVRRSWEERDNEYLVLILRSHLQKGKVYTLHTAFCGQLADDLAGFYRCQYEEDGKNKFLAVTMMQPTDARKVFPCFDEPALKATFDLAVIHLPQHTAISNMPIIKRSQMWVLGQMWIITTFDRTLKMSSYLLACVVSEFQSIEEIYNGVKIRVWGRQQAISAGQGAYALKAAGKLLDFYEQKYNIYFPLTKIDLVAVPCFESGGMENWGMIVFRETNLLFDPEENTEGNKLTMLLVIAHELTHQWFGNLVTMRWWNDLWLNEGLATYFSYEGTNYINREWTVDSVFAGKSLRFALASDALPNSHPLSPREHEVTTSDLVGQLFDDISYEKAASVLRMICNFLTEKVFLQGLLSYLREFSYKTVNYADLRNHLQMAVNNQSAVRLPSNLWSILDTWILQMGYPVVTINTTSGLVTQKHFLLDSTDKVARHSRFGYKWYIPVTWQKNNSIQKTFWINKTKEVIVGEMEVNDQTWILANVNAVGIFRVNYDDENWDKLLILLMKNRDAIPVINRAQLIDDAFSLARGKHIPITRALETTRYLHMETEYLPWDTLSNHLDFIELILKENPGYTLLETRGRGERRAREGVGR
uniref:aminopeptidase Ey-like n=1 Tax=Pristiophorus japonicus TaxID=55135 RepID=UPI00398E96E8